MIYKPETFVSIDIETTGLDPELSKIIEIGAVKVKNGNIIDEYSRLVKPDVPIPDYIIRLTGITNEDVKSEESIGDVIPSFLDFIGGYRLIGQNVGFDVAFLRRAAGIGNIDTAVDNIDLARILLPCLSSYSLDSLIDFFALNPEKRHRALADARVTAFIFLKLIDMLRMVPILFLNEMIRISSLTGSNLRDIFEVHLLERSQIVEPTASNKIPVLPKQKEQSTNIFGDFSREPSPQKSHTVTVDPGTLSSLLQEGGRFSQHCEAYEERHGQIDLARKIAVAFNDSEILLAEAGTGIGKSIAYLIPAIMWADAARERVVISTNTKNLQEQLFFKDIPILSKVIDFPFRAVILKGRGNYICLHRWQRVIETPERYLAKGERDFLLPVAGWLLDTTTGDLSETGFFSMLSESGLLDRINSDSVSCLGQRCQFREKCFVNRVRKAAQHSHIVIVNHSVVFSDMVSEGRVLGLYSRIVFDEAHNIEKVALRNLGVVFDYYRVRRVLNRLYTKNEYGYGLFAMLRKWVMEMAKGWPEFANYRATIDSAIETVEHLRSITRELFEHLNLAVRLKAATVMDHHEGKLRYIEDETVFSACSDTITAFSNSVTSLIQTIGTIMAFVMSASSTQLDDKEEISIDLEKSSDDLKALLSDLGGLIEAHGRNVFWFEYVENSDWFSLKIHSAPLDVGEKLAVYLYDHMETVIMTSATLTVARDFSYIRQRLGINLDRKERVTEFIADSPFDYQRQAAVFMPTYLPSPKHDAFIEKTNEVLYTLAGKVGRGMLVLFTSRGHLYRSYYDLKDGLMQNGITLLGQGIDGSRTVLLRRFREDISSVLFGTDSFWEGVDVPGSALELVVIVKLPFAVPEAAIRLRQGAGRLIRHRSDRGAVIVLDPRIVTTKYGQVFRRCLMGKVLKVESVERLIEEVKRWFG